MYSIICTLSFIGILLIILSFYLKYRLNYYGTVNCWFCNQWIKVPIEMKNSWICSNCEQYNGFNKDGDYNKEIPAQYDELLNKFPSRSVILNKKNSNGLCAACNNNQQLKIDNLAMFTPKNENMFKEELSIYEKKLENVYKLCDQCNLTVNRVLNQEKSFLLQLRLQILKKERIHFLNLSNTNIRYKKILRALKKNFFLILIQLTTCILATCHLLTLIRTCSFSQKNIISILPNNLVSYVFIIRDVVNVINEIFYYYIDIVIVCHRSLSKMYASFIPTVNYYEFLINNIYLFINCPQMQIMIGIIFQTVFLLLIKNKDFIEHFKLIVWVILLYVNAKENHKLTEANLPEKLLEVSCYCFLISMTLFKYYYVIKHTIYKSKSPKHQSYNQINTSLMTKSIEGFNPTFKCPDEKSCNFLSNPVLNKINSGKLFNTYPEVYNINGTYNQCEQKQNYEKSYKPSFNNSIQYRSTFMYSETIYNLKNDEYYNNCNKYYSNNFTEMELNKGLNELHLNK